LQVLIIASQAVQTSIGAEKNAGSMERGSNQSEELNVNTPLECEIVIFELTGTMNYLWKPPIALNFKSGSTILSLNYCQSDRYMKLDRRPMRFSPSPSCAAGRNELSSGFMPLFLISEKTIV
jgi:hypothetical protein